MQEVEGIATLRMSGARATFTLKDGVTFEEQRVAASFAKRDMQLETFAKHNAPRPQSMRRYLVNAGLG